MLAALVLICTAVGLIGAQAMEERDETERIQSDMANGIGSLYWRRESADATNTPSPIPSDSPAPVPEPVNEPPPPDAPEPPPVLPLATVEPVTTEAPSGAGSTICGIFGPYCADALAVAQCESTDYYAAGGYYHIGAFQLAFQYHADKFAAHGWDMWAEGNDVYKNATIAYDIFAGRGYSWLGTSGWPVCGWRAGY